MSDEIKMTPETGMTDEEIAELEKQRSGRQGGPPCSLQGPAPAH